MSALVPAPRCAVGLHGVRAVPVLRAAQLTSARTILGPGWLLWLVAWLLQKRGPRRRGKG